MATGEGILTFTGMCTRNWIYPGDGQGSCSPTLIGSRPARGPPRPQWTRRSAVAGRRGECAAAARPALPTAVTGAGHPCRQAEGVSRRRALATAPLPTQPHGRCARTYTRPVTGGWATEEEGVCMPPPPASKTSACPACGPVVTQRRGPASPTPRAVETQP